MIWYFYTLQKDDHDKKKKKDNYDKSRYHLSTQSYCSITNYIPDAVLYTLGLVYFITASLYLSTSSTTPLPSGNRQCILCIFESETESYSMHKIVKTRYPDANLRWQFSRPWTEAL